MGVSGGEEGRAQRPVDHARRIRTGLPETSAPCSRPSRLEVDGGTPCCTHVGPDGAGHFRKMVHNGIEYADMQLIAEAYDLLRNGGGVTSQQQIAEIFRTWNEGRLDLLPHPDHRRPRSSRTPTRRSAQAVRGHRARPGRAEGHRPVDCVQDALDLGVLVNGIAEAVFARSLSGHADPCGAARQLATSTPGTQVSDQFPDLVEQALYASKLVSYAQGWNMIAAGAAPSTTGASTWPRWPRSGAAAALSAPSSSTEIRHRLRETSPTPTTLLADPRLRHESRSAMPRTPGARWSPPPSGSASRFPASRPRSPTTTTRCGPGGCPRR